MANLATGALDYATSWWYREKVEAPKNETDETNKGVEGVPGEGQENIDDVVQKVGNEVLNNAQQKVANEIPKLEWTVEGCINYGKSLQGRSVEYYRTSTSDVQSRKKAEALAKTIFDSVSIYFGFWGTVGGAFLAYWSPEGMNDVCQMVDRLISRSIKDWTFDKRMLLMAGCTGTFVAASYLWVPIVPMVCSIYTVKIGGELYFLSERFFENKTH